MTVADGPPKFRIAVIAPSWVGDACMATPAFRALRAARPEASIELVCRPGLDRLLGASPWFDRITVDSMRGLAGPFRGGRRLRSRRPDEIVLFPNSFRTALAAFLSRAPHRIGFRRDLRGPLLTGGVPMADRGSPCPTLASYCELLERGLGIAVADRRPELFLDPRADRAAAEGLLAGVPRPFALLVPGGNRDDKRWPVERFAALAESLAERGLASVATGSPGERPLLAALAARSRVPIHDLSRSPFDLGVLKGVVAAARICIANDTGPRHLAAALSIPTVALFGPTDHRWTLLPGVPERLLVAEPFLPGDRMADRHAKACRIDRIALGDVLDATDRLLAGRPPIADTGGA
jgi:heptosyltransferase-2